MKENNLKNLEKIVNSQLASKIQQSNIENNELLFEVKEEDLVETIQFLKSNDKCKFKQLIDVAGVDYPDNEKRFQLIYLLLSHEYNLRVKILINFDEKQPINSMGTHAHTRARAHRRTSALAP